MTDSEKRTLIRFGAKLQKLRLDKGLTLRQLSANCKVDHSKISQMEHGGINPTLITLLELAKGLEVDILELVQHLQ